MKRGDILPTYEDVVKLLKALNKTINKNKLLSFDVNLEDYQNMDKHERYKFENNLDFAKEKGWIKDTFVSKTTPISFNLTALGKEIAEGRPENQAAISNVFNVENNSGVIASNASGFTINQGIRFADIEKLVNEKIANSDERKLIIETLQKLESLMETGDPLEKGVLSKINIYLQEHSWLASPVVGAVLQYLTTKIL